MVKGLDTGFFIEIMKGNQAAAESWDSFSVNGNAVIVSVLTLGEVLYFAFRVGRPEQGKVMAQGITTAANVIDVNQDIVEKASALKAGRNIPYVDALIIATFMENACTEIHTTDRNHFGEIKNKGLQFVFWN